MTNVYLAHMSHIQSVKLFRDQQAATKTYDLKMSFVCLWKRQRLNVRNIHKLAKKSMHLGHVSHIKSVKLVRDQQAATKTHDLKMSTDNMYLEHMYHTQSVKLFRDQQAATKSHDLN